MRYRSRKFLPHAVIAFALISSAAVSGPAWAQQGKTGAQVQLRGPRTPILACLDSVTALFQSGQAASLAPAQHRDTVGIAAAMKPFRDYAKQCTAQFDAKGLKGEDVGVFGSLQVASADFSNGIATLKSYIADKSVEPKERSMTVEQTQRFAGAGHFSPERLITIAEFVDLADSVNFPRGRMNTRIFLAQLCRTNAKTADKSFTLVRDVITIAKEDPDTTLRAKRAKSMAGIVRLATAWAEQDGRSYDSQTIMTMAEGVFGKYKEFRAVFHPEALIGMPAEPIVAPRWINAQGNVEKITFGDGKIHIVEMTAHWCGPCRASYPAVEAAYAKYKDKGVDVVFATQLYGYFGETPDLAPTAELDSLKGYFASHKITYPVAVAGAFDGKNGRNVNFENYNSTGLPTIVLVDRKGIIRQLFQGWDESAATALDAEMEKILADDRNTGASAKGK